MYLLLVNWASSKTEQCRSDGLLSDKCEKKQIQSMCTSRVITALDLNSGSSHGRRTELLT